MLIRVYPWFFFLGLGLERAYPQCLAFLIRVYPWFFFLGLGLGLERAYPQWLAFLRVEAFQRQGRAGKAQAGRFFKGGPGVLVAI